VTDGGYVLTFGETMALVRATEVGDLADVHDARFGTGGADSNVAIGLARLGVPAVWVGRVGADGLGRRVLRDIRGEGVAVHGIVDPDAATGLMVKEKRTPHTTRVLFYRDGSAGSRLRAGDIPVDAVRGAAHVHVSGITASLSSTAAEAVRSVLDTAEAAGVPISFDVNHRASLWRAGDPGELYREIARRARIVFAGVDEAELLVGPAGGDRGVLAARICALGPATAVIKDGARGSLAREGGVVAERAALAVPVVDSVGAGDAFVAGFLAARVRGERLSACLELATASGAFACMGAGDWESMARTADLELLTDNDPVTR